MDWFKKHLNLTALFFIIVWFAVTLAFVNHEAALLGVGLVGGILYLVLCGWILRRKGQSQWFLVAVFFLWWIIFLFPNKNTVKETIEYEYTDEPRL